MGKREGGQKGTGMLPEGDCAGTFVFRVLKAGTFRGGLRGESIEYYLLS